MKWFKHNSDASSNDKIGKLEAEFGLIGYAVYFKIVEICAANWDEVSYPKFSFSASQIKSKLSLNYVKTESILSLASVLNLFSFQKNGKYYEIEFPNLEKIKKRYQKNDVAATNEKPTNSTPNKRKNKEEEKETENFVFDEVVNDEVFASYQITEGYPRHVFDEFAKEAWPLYSVDPNPTKNWKRFLANYIKNNKPRIRDMILEKAREEKSYSQITKELFEQGE
jgi:hypothetical protein